MADDQGLLAAIRANPNDDALKLIYADWLEEHGDRCAEFLRLSVSLRSMPQEDERYSKLLARWWELHQTISAEWIALVDKTSAEDDVREAIFRYLFGKHYVPEGLLFIRIGENHDPSPLLLSRFKYHRATVKAHSSSNHDEKGRRCILDRESGKQGILFWISKLTWTSDKGCTLKGGYYAGPLASAMSEYTVVLKHGKWQVLKEKLLLIS